MYGSAMRPSAKHEVLQVAFERLLVVMKQYSFPVLNRNLQILWHTKVWLPCGSEMLSWTVTHLGMQGFQAL